mmetsp:Transcript_3203/g.8499  ORF Transcript_3203/g.8499 Transcript_3203/m.8499 type:complete len:225 (+) Transcript_3203:622-1296(+)
MENGHPSQEGQPQPVPLHDVPDHAAQDDARGQLGGKGVEVLLFDKVLVEERVHPNATHVSELVPSLPGQLVDVVAIARAALRVAQRLSVHTRVDHDPPGIVADLEAWLLLGVHCPERPVHLERVKRLAQERLVLHALRHERVVPQEGVAHDQKVEVLLRQLRQEEAEELDWILEADLSEGPEPLHALARPAAAVAAGAGLLPPELPAAAVATRGLPHPHERAIN